MTEELLIELGFVKNDYDFYYNYTKGDILSHMIVCVGCLSSQ